VIRKLMFLLVLSVASFPLSHVFALADPDVIQIDSANRYENVAVSGDMFILVEYTLNYTVLPDESISQGWMGRLLDVGGSGQLASLQPFSGSSIPDLGYSAGVYGFYFSTAPTITGTLRVTLDGNPALIPTPVGTYTESIIIRDSGDLAPDLREIALRLEEVWDVDLVSPIFGGVNRYTVDGEHYFASALPNLRNAAPDMFILQSIQPGVPDRVFDTTYTDERRAVFDGTPMATGFASLATFLRVSDTVARFIVALILAIGVAFAVSRYLNTEVQFMATIQVWVVYLVFMGGFWIGLVTAPVLGILTVLALMATAIVFFLQRTSA